MNRMTLNTEFVGTCQNMSLDADGNKYYVAISKGGFMYKDTEFADEVFDCECSRKFDDYKSAFLFYSRLMFRFGRGDYSWEGRKKLVKEGFDD